MATEPVSLNLSELIREAKEQVLERQETAEPGCGTKRRPTKD